MYFCLVFEKELKVGWAARGEDQEGLEGGEEYYQDIFKFKIQMGRPWNVTQLVESSGFHPPTAHKSGIIVYV